MGSYDHKKIEKKWRARWKKADIYKTRDEYERGKSYVLDMFPYPSGEGLHVGHPKGYIATDVYSRFMRMQGKNVLHPMGFDAFGLPAENYALKTKTNPEIAVKKNVTHYKEQLELFGFNYDWSREINTTDPEYYKWTQWIFLQLYDAGLVYESHEPINWCPSCKTGLANEDVEDGRCERCGTLVEKKPIRQWMLRITEYAEKLLSGLKNLDWPESIKELQKNWIGKSEGAQIKFSVKGTGCSVEVFTTRADTLFGATYLVLAPEHSLVKILAEQSKNKDEVLRYIVHTEKKTEMERIAGDKEKTGVELKGIQAINPANKKEIPVFVADYILAQYGTGAIMAVPAHDERDFQFAKKYDLPVLSVIGPKEKIPNLNEGVLTNSGTFNGLESRIAKKRITEFVGGKEVITYKLRDWVFSRQRYWGEPIPLIHCEKCGVVPVPEKDLPVRLPKVKHYEPTGTGESPLAGILKWVNVKCPNCGGKGKRETNTMPQWAGSSWYYLRYMDPRNEKRFVDLKKEEYWSPVDFYVGGAEHATRHLIYARFWHQFLYDQQLVSKPEPFIKLQHVGLILAEDGRKMSKRWGNVINPDEIIEKFGADSLRVYEMFMGPFDQAIAWNTDNLVGARRFLERVWNLSKKVGGENYKDSEDLKVMLHKSIRKVTRDITIFKFNTAVSQLMILVNACEREVKISLDTYHNMLLLLSPFAPHISEELWSKTNGPYSIHTSTWPLYDEALVAGGEIVIGVQVNGKTRGTIEVSANISESDAVSLAMKMPEISKWFGEKMPRRIVYVPGKILNLIM